MKNCCYYFINILILLVLIFCITCLSYASNYVQITPNPINIGAVQEGKTVTKTVNITNVSGGGLQIKPDISAPFSLETSDMFVLAKGESNEITIKYTASTIGDYRGKLLLTYYLTPDRSVGHTISVPVTVSVGQAPSNLTISTDRILKNKPYTLTWSPCSKAISYSVLEYKDGNLIHKYNVNNNSITLKHDVSHPTQYTYYVQANYKYGSIISDTSKTIYISPPRTLTIIIHNVLDGNPNIDYTKILVKLFNKKGKEINEYYSNQYGQVKFRDLLPDQYTYKVYNTKGANNQTEYWGKGEITTWENGNYSLIFYRNMPVVRKISTNLVNRTILVTLKNYLTNAISVLFSINGTSTNPTIIGPNSSKKLNINWYPGNKKYLYTLYIVKNNKHIVVDTGFYSFKIDKFLWGVSISAFQTEMAPNSTLQDTDWYQWTHDPYIINKEKYVSGDYPEGTLDNPGPDFWDNYKEYIDLAAKNGFKAMRISIEWARIFPHSTEGVKVKVIKDPNPLKIYDSLRGLNIGGNKIYLIKKILINHNTLSKLDKIADQKAVRHYLNILKYMRSKGIIPIVTLYHWPLPIWIHDYKTVWNKCLSMYPCKDGPIGWISLQTVIEFSKYVAYIVNKYKNVVDIWITLNEPQSIVGFGYLTPCGKIIGGFDHVQGLCTNDNIEAFPPGLFNVYYAQVVNLRLSNAHILAYKLIKKFDPSSFVGISLVFQAFRGIENHKEIKNASYVEHADYITNKWWLNTLIKGEIDANYDGNITSTEIRNYYKNTLDWIGVNYYQKEYVEKARLGQNLIVPSALDFFPLSAGIGCQGWNVTNDSLTINITNSCSDLGWPIYPKGLKEILEEIKGYNLPIIITENGIADSSLKDIKRAKYIKDHVCEIYKAQQEGIKVFGYLYWALFDNFEWAKGWKPKFGLFTRKYRTNFTKPRECSVSFYKNLIRYEGNNLKLKDPCSLSIACDNKKKNFIIVSNSFSSNPLTVTFICNTSVSNVKYLWDFDGDGKIDYISTSNKVTYTYNKYGKYVVRVTIIDKNGDKLTKEIYINLVPTNNESNNSQNNNQNNQNNQTSNNSHIYNYRKLLYCISKQNKLYSIDPNTGKTNLIAKIDGIDPFLLASSPDGYLYGLCHHKLVKIDPKTGEIVKQLTLIGSLPHPGGMACDKDGHLYVMSGFYGALHSINLKTGKINNIYGLNLPSIEINSLLINFNTNKLYGLISSDYRYIKLIEINIKNKQIKTIVNLKIPNIYNTTNLTLGSEYDPYNNKIYAIIYNKLLTINVDTKSIQVIATLPFVSGSLAMLWPNNTNTVGNITYKIILASRIKWEDAKKAAEKYGPDWHLATILNKQQEDAVVNLIKRLHVEKELWLGGYQKPINSLPAKNWHWVTGAKWNYTNWAPGEPNDCGGDEHYLCIHTYDNKNKNVLGKWNDERFLFNIGGYIIERENKLVAYWSFNDKTAKDDTGNGNNGIINEGQTWGGNSCTPNSNNCVKVVNGINGTAFKFTGNNWIDIGKKKYLANVLESQTFTISMWVNPDRVTSNTQRGMIVYWDDDTQSGGDRWIGINHGKIFFTGFKDPTVGNYTIEPHHWYYIVYESDRTNNISKFYVNGRLVDVVNKCAYPHTNRTYVALGAGHYGYIWNYSYPARGERYHGILDEVKIYSGLLTDQEIKDNYNSYFNNNNSQLKILSLTATPLKGSEPLTVQFKCLAEDQNGTIQDYKWDFDGDGITDTITYYGNVQYTYYNPGKYIATVTVEDSNGNKITKSVTVQVSQNEAPVIKSFSIANPITGTPNYMSAHVPFKVIFNCNAYDPDGYITEYKWDFNGDSEIDHISTNGTVSYTYDLSGNYTPTVTVVDNKGAESKADDITIHAIAPNKHWYDITSNLYIKESRPLFDRYHRCLFIYVTIKNLGPSIPGPIRLDLINPNIPVDTSCPIGAKISGKNLDSNTYYFDLIPEDGIFPIEKQIKIRINFRLERKRLRYQIKIKRYGRYYQ